MILSKSFIIITILILIINIIQINAEENNDKNTQQQQIEQQIEQQKDKKFKNFRTKLYNSDECHDDIIKYCPEARSVELGDLNVLKCLYNEIKDFSVLDTDCQHLVYSFKLNLTKTLRLDASAESICKDEIQRFDDCKNVDDVNGHLVSCLVEKLDDINNLKCKSFLSNIATILFTDYRLIYNFQEKCADDINNLKCGRLDTAENSPTDQGKTIACLSDKFAQLNPQCRKEIFRISELQSEDFHLDRALYFACKDDREKFCSKVVSGKGNVYKCLMENKFKPEMSKECQDQITRRQKMIAENANMDRSFINACRKDILQNDCRGAMRNNNTEKLSLASILLCLEAASKNGAKIEPDCKAEMMEHRKMLLSDYRLNPDLMNSCTSEINTFCNGGIERAGKTIHCLLRNAKNVQTRQKYSHECMAELRKLVKVADAGEDIRVDPHLSESCQNVITGACKGIQPGKGRMLDCLMKNIDTNDMTEECEERLLEIEFFVSRDWKLNPVLFKTCKNDAIKFCNAKNTWHDWTTDVDEGPLILPCLYHHINDEDEKSSKDDKVSQGCATEVRRVMQIRAKSIDLMPEIQEACTIDLSTKCSNSETTKKGEELRCLQSKYDELEQECKDAIEKFTEDEAKDIRLDQILMKSCLPIINEYCGDEKSEGKGDLLECLIKQKNNPKLEQKCRYGIEHHQLINLKNINFNYKFKRACENNIKTLCVGVNDKVEVIQCLSEYVLNDTLLENNQRVDPLCRSQLKFELLQMNEDVRLDPLLFKACSEDIKEFCANVPFGKAQTLECLKTNINKLSEDCGAKLTKRKKIDIIDQGVDYKLKEKCKSAILEYCSVDGGEVDLLSCLRKNLLQPSLSTECRKIVINRIMTQNKDIRLNPSLWKSCKSEAEEHCKNEFLSLEAGEELNGRVINCLKAKFVENKLNRDCSLEIEVIMREAANIDYRLDPLLTEACLNEIHDMCGQATDDKKEDCLRLNFQQKKIDPNTKCFGEVKRIILEGAADIFADHELHEACYSDLNRICYDVAPGAAQQLKCLLDAKSSGRVNLAPKCSQSLIKRRELWNLAKVSDDITGLQDLYYTINNSNNRFYIFGVLFTIIIIIFVLGCTLRPAFIRTKWDKLK